MPDIARRIIIIVAIVIASLNNKPIMNIRIDKINVNEEIYAKESENNNIDKHVIILKESGYPDSNLPVIIGAHSGIGPLAYFKNLNKLEKGDEVILTYKGQDYKYVVNNKYKDDKNGLIKIEGGNDLVLFTCYPNDKKNYLIVVSSLQV